MMKKIWRKRVWKRIRLCNIRSRAKLTLSILLHKIVTIQIAWMKEMSRCVDLHKPVLSKMISWLLQWKVKSREEELPSNRSLVAKEICFQISMIIVGVRVYGQHKLWVTLPRLVTTSKKMKAKKLGREDLLQRSKDLVFLRAMTWKLEKFLMRKISIK